MEIRRALAESEMLLLFKKKKKKSVNFNLSWICKSPHYTISNNIQCMFEAISELYYYGIGGRDIDKSYRWLYTYVILRGTW